MKILVFRQGNSLIFVLLVLAAFLLLQRSIVRAACTGNSVFAEGLVTGFSVVTGQTGGCIEGGGTYVPLNQARIFVGDYQSLFNKYYDRNNAAGFSKSDLAANSEYDNMNSALPGKGNRMFHALGNLTLKNALIESNSSDILVFFVEENLNIEYNILQGENTSSGGVVFVVKGNINIAEEAKVTPPGMPLDEINAVFIAQGVICTACDSAGNVTSKYERSGRTLYDTQLNIFGSLVALTRDNKIKFARFLQNNRVSAEQVSAQAKYLVILRRVFDEKLKIYREI